MVMSNFIVQARMILLLLREDESFLNTVETLYFFVEILYNKENIPQKTICILFL